MAPGTRRAKRRSPICSTTSRCFTTAAASTRHSAMFRRSDSLQSGSAVSTSKQWQHDPAPLLDEKPREAQVSRAAVLVTPTGTTYRAILESVQAGAKKAGVKTLVAETSIPQEIENAFSMMARGKADAVIVGNSTFFIQQRRQIAELALKHRIPSMFGTRANVEAGGLISYGPNITDNYHRAATYVDKILKGAKPADLPVEQPVTLELVVNLKTAKALGLTIPQSLLVRADDVIQ